MQRVVRAATCLLLVGCCVSGQTTTTNAVNVFNNFTAVVNTVIFFGALAASVVIIYVVATLGVIRYVVNLPSTINTINASGKSRNFGGGSVLDDGFLSLLERLGILLEAWKRYDVTDARCRQRLACELRHVATQRHLEAATRNMAQLTSAAGDVRFSGTTVRNWMPDWMRSVLLDHVPDSGGTAYCSGRNDGCHVSSGSRMVELLWSIPIFELYESFDDD